MYSLSVWKKRTNCKSYHRRHICQCEKFISLFVWILTVFFYHFFDSPFFVLFFSRGFNQLFSGQWLSRCWLRMARMQLQCQSLEFFAVTRNTRNTRMEQEYVEINVRRPSGTTTMHIHQCLTIKWFLNFAVANGVCRYRGWKQLHTQTDYTLASTGCSLLALLPPLATLSVCLVSSTRRRTIWRVVNTAQFKPKWIFMCTVSTAFCAHRSQIYMFVGKRNSSFSVLFLRRKFVFVLVFLSIFIAIHVHGTGKIVHSPHYLLWSGCCCFGAHNAARAHGICSWTAVSCSWLPMESAYGSFCLQECELRFSFGYFRCVSNKILRFIGTVDSSFAFSVHRTHYHC